MNPPAIYGFLLAFLPYCYGSHIKPGYLDFDNLPETNFSCEGKVIGGYYADVETGCQMFHVCTIGQKGDVSDIKFLCLNGTVFDQETRVCERIDEVDCDKSETFFGLNLELYGNSPTFSDEEEEIEEDCLNEDCLEEYEYEDRASTTIRTTTTTTTRKPTTIRTTKKTTTTTTRKPTTIRTTTTRYQYQEGDRISALLSLHNAFDQSLRTTKPSISVNLKTKYQTEDDERFDYDRPYTTKPQLHANYHHFQSADTSFTHSFDPEKPYHFQYFRQSSPRPFVRNKVSVVTSTSTSTSIHVANSTHEHYDDYSDAFFEDISKLRAKRETPDYPIEIDKEDVINITDNSNNNDKRNEYLHNLLGSIDMDERERRVVAELFKESEPEMRKAREGGVDMLLEKLEDKLMALEGTGPGASFEYEGETEKIREKRDLWDILKESKKDLLKYKMQKIDMGKQLDELKGKNKKKHKAVKANIDFDDKIGSTSKELIEEINKSKKDQLNKAINRKLIGEIKDKMKNSNKRMVKIDKREVRIDGNNKKMKNFHWELNKADEVLNINGLRNIKIRRKRKVIIPEKDSEDIKRNRGISDGLRDTRQNVRRKTIRTTTEVGKLMKKLYEVKPVTEEIEDDVTTAAYKQPSPWSRRPEISTIPPDNQRLQSRFDYNSKPIRRRPMIKLRGDSISTTTTLQPISRRTRTRISSTLSPSKGTTQLSKMSTRSVPDINFSCRGKVKGGHYADIDNDCKAFFVCTQATRGLTASHFWCGEGTKFNQKSRTCQAEDLVDCRKAKGLYSVNENINSDPSVGLEDMLRGNFEPMKI